MILYKQHQIIRIKKAEKKSEMLTLSSRTIKIMKLNDSEANETNNIWPRSLYLERMNAAYK